ncbi:hypothetical protein C1878_04270 [Gordonibacter sp. 28C]|uniref:hypothetical protein n=1 Tax=Gordonibacter sp. 28C TaxID=2078569 RepID=UPI000DF863FB|nr:hypothetical protein [Gordonibacter sp. 28C]RDB63398.1 hypothetical protein C1878_04270 [Gordonibacter sp. 28C]
MRDVSLLLWLRARHARWTLNWFMHLVGAGVEDGGRAERAYQLYAVGIMLAWFALMASALVSAVVGAFALADVGVCALAMRVALALPAAALAWVGIAAVRGTPLKLSHPDIAYLAASPVSARALVGTAVSVQATACAAAAGVVGWLAGVGLESAGVFAVSPVGLALALAALAGVSVAVGWLAGVVRLASPAWRRRNTVLCALGFAALAVVWIAALLAAPAAALLDPATPVALAAGAAASGAAVAAALAVVAPRMDMTVVIEENALHADLCRFGMLSPLDPTVIAEYQRRRRFADRTVRFSLPRREGRAALVSRAALSHARQYDGIPMLLMHGALVVPLGVLALLGAGGPALFLFWLMAMVMTTQGVREATRPFRDDVRNRLVRDRLPFGVLELLAFDSLPAFAVTTLLACVVVAVSAPAGTSMPLALALAVLVNAGSVLGCGLDAVRLFPGGPRLCYEYGALALVGASFALALFAPPPGIVAGVALVCVVIALAVHNGAECAR